MFFCCNSLINKAKELVVDPIKENIIDPIKEHIIDPIVETIVDVAEVAANIAVGIYKNNFKSIFKKCKKHENK